MAEDSMAVLETLRKAGADGVVDVAVDRHQVAGAAAA